MLNTLRLQPETAASDLTYAMCLMTAHAASCNGDARAWLETVCATLRDAVREPVVAAGALDRIGFGAGVVVGPAAVAAGFGDGDGRERALAACASAHRAESDASRRRAERSAVFNEDGAVRLTVGVGGGLLTILVSPAARRRLPEGLDGALASAAPALVTALDRALLDRARRQAALLEPLSPSQRKVALMLGDPIAELDIARRLERSRHTIHDHTKNIYRLWRVRSRLELIALWHGRGRGTRPADDGRPDD